MTFFIKIFFFLNLALLLFKRAFPAIARIVIVIVIDIYIYISIYSYRSYSVIEIHTWRIDPATSKGLIFI